MTSGKPVSQINYKDSWELEPLRKKIDFYLFLKSLPIIFDEGCVLVLTDVLSEEMEVFLGENQPLHKPVIEEFSDDSDWFIEIKLMPPSVKKVKRNPLHIVMTNCNMKRLIEIAEHCAEPEICTHLGVYRNNNMLMVCHDASSGNSFPFINGDVDESRVREFCEAVGYKYRKYVMAD